MNAGQKDRDVVDFQSDGMFLRENMGLANANKVMK